MQGIGATVRGFGEVEQHEVNKRGKWSRARVGGKRRGKQDEVDEDDTRGGAKKGDGCGSSGCSTSRVRTRQCTLWGLWNNNSRGESSRASEAEVNGWTTSWGGPSKDRKGDG